MPEIKKDYPEYSKFFSYSSGSRRITSKSNSIRDTDKNKITQTKAKIISNKKIVSNYYKLIIQAPFIAKNALAGQFVMVRIDESLEPLLRRPFSIHRVKDSRIEILYEVIGKGTDILTKKKPGQFLDVIGPLGNGFDYGSPRHHVTTSPILVAGGMGVAPLLFLAEKLVSHQVTKSPRHQLLVLIGARTRKQILCVDEFKKLGCKVKISTDDGSVGFKGKATDLLKHLLSTMDYGPSTIYTCGPKPMLKEISTLSRKFKIPGQGSLEAHMACGIGACMGCVVATTTGYKRVCKDGPVFDLKEIKW